MPRGTTTANPQWTNADWRKYDAIVESSLAAGHSERRAKQIAAGTVNRDRTARSARETIGQNLEWRKRQIILEPELVEQLFDWHGGQFTPTYALASTGQNNLVSLSMIDAVLNELGPLSRSQSTPKRDRAELRDLLGDLDAVRRFWREHSAEWAGMDIKEYEYDTADYGLTPEEEVEILTTSG